MGLALRAWNLSEVGLDHYDEGVYAFSALGLTDSDQPRTFYPQQYKFSPVVFISLISLPHLLFDVPRDMSAFLVNVILGTLTIFVVWRLGRHWFGVRAGIVAAALLTFSEYHITLSRSALTDIGFALVFLLALGAIVKTFEQQRFSMAIFAGLLTGLAWNTKYHGWFALVIAAGVFIAMTVFGDMDAKVRKKNLLLWCTMAGIAFVCYLPWALYIQSVPGGYVDFAKYQRSMLSPDWFGNLWRQAQQQYFLEGVFSRLGVFAALLGALLTQPKTGKFSKKFLVTTALLVVSVLAFGSTGTTVILTILILPGLFSRKDMAGWFLLCWLALWFFITPLYHPYMRLLLPFTIATFIAAGAWIQKLIDSEQIFEQKDWRPIMVFPAILIILVVSPVLPDTSDPWRSSRSVGEAAQEMQSLIPVDSRVVVIGEPPLAFYLHLSNRPAFERTEDYEHLVEIEEPVYLVTGVYSHRAPMVREALKKLSRRLKLLGTFPMAPKDLRILDDFKPAPAREFRARPDDTYLLRLYLFSPDQTTENEAKSKI